MKDKPSKRAKSQETRNPLKPLKKVRIAKVYILPDEECKVEVLTGNVSDVEMVQFLRDITKVFAQKLIEDASEVVGDSPEEQEKYLNWRINQSGLDR